MGWTDAFFCFPFWIARLNHELGDAYIMQKGKVPGRNGRKNSNWMISKRRDEEELLKQESSMPYHVFHQFFLVAAVLSLKAQKCGEMKTFCFQQHWWKENILLAQHRNAWKKTTL